MAIKFENIQPGMTLYDIHWERAGNTMMRRLGQWDVQIISVDPVKRTALARWNGNPPTTCYVRALQRLFVKPTKSHEEQFEYQRKSIFF